MRILLSFFFCLCLVQFGSAQPGRFYDKVLGYDNCKDCYFIVLEVESEAYTGKVLIENDDLQDFLSKTESLDRVRYREYVKDILINRRKVIIKNSYLDGDFLNVKNVSERKFRLLNESEKVNKIASRGCVQFLKYYFLEESLASIQHTESSDCKEFIKSQNKDLSLLRGEASFLKEQNTIVKVLFEWEIPIRMNHYSGWLVIDKVNFQETRNPNR